MKPFKKTLPVIFGLLVFILILSANANSCPADDHRCHTIQEIDEADPRLATAQLILDTTTFYCGEPDEYSQTQETAVEACELGIGNVEVMRIAAIKSREKLAKARKIEVPGTNPCDVRRLIDQPRSDSEPKSVRGWVYQLTYKADLAIRRGIQPRWALTLISSKTDAAWDHVNNAFWHVTDTVFFEGWDCTAQ